MLFEFYTVLAIDLDNLRSQAQSGDLDPTARARIGELENLLNPKPLDYKKYRGLYPDEATGVWEHARKTGDALADYWEYRASRGLDIDLELKEPPPKSEWSKE